MEIPIGYAPRTVNGSLKCYRLVEQSCPVGNPVTPGSGAKLLEETDYTSEGANPLCLTRIYNSFGCYRPVSASRERGSSMGDYWQTTFNRRIYPVSFSASIMAVAVRPDGTVKHFDNAGREVLNQGVTRKRIERFTDGWRYFSAEDEVETYNAAGRLLSIRNLVEQTQSLTYSNEKARPRLSHHIPVSCYA